VVPWRDRRSRFPEKGFVMNRSKPRRLSAVLLTLTLTLLSAPAWAAGGWEARTAQGQGLFAAVWEYLGSLVGATTDTDGRAGMDPNGATAPTSDSGAESDGRATLDPNG
jgi:hypothetical protein